MRLTCYILILMIEFDMLRIFVPWDAICHAMGRGYNLMFKCLFPAAMYRRIFKEDLHLFYSAAMF